MNILSRPFVIRTVNIEGDSLRSEHRPRPCGRLRKVVEGSTGRDSTYPNVILFTAALLPFSSRISSVSTYLKALYLPLLLSHPATPFFSSVVRVSLLTTRIPSFPPPPRPLPRVPTTLPPPPRHPLRALRTEPSSPSRSRFLRLFLPLASTDLQT